MYLKLLPRSAFLGVVTSLSLASVALLGEVSFAGPDCLDNDGAVIPVINEQVVAWKTSTPNSYRARAHILGSLIRHYPDHSGHHHLEVSLGANSQSTIEVIYNEDFGAIPDYQPGSVIEACGDYITAMAQAGPYPPSPDGAIIHWVHRSPNLNKHPSGYLTIDGVICGNNAENAGPKPQ